ncbi:helix-turn-helix domain-containing protein [Actinomadura litoris]|nr:helix-turn-helix transcriptional regulator [Actinomadura litoris]
MDDTTIGQRVFAYREERGMTRAELAGAVDRSIEWLKSVEIGRRQLDRYSIIAALADALDVHVVALLGVPHQGGDAQQQRAHMAIPALRRVLLRAEMPPRAIGAPLPITDLRDRLSDAHRQRRHAHYGELAHALPQLLMDTAATAAALDGTERERAFGLLAEARHDAAMATKKLGYVDLASIAAAQAVRAATASGDPMLITAMVWTQAEVYITAGAVDEAHEITTGQIDQLDPLLGQEDPAVWSLWGTLHLVESVIQAQWRRREEAASHLVEAAAAAGRVGAGVSRYQTEFGPGNKAIHSVHVALELGEGSEALDRIEGVDMSALPKERRARHGIDRALARSRDGDDPGAMGELMDADLIAPECVRNHPLTTEMVRTAAHRSKVVKEPIAAAAERLGIVI